MRKLVKLGSALREAGQEKRGAPWVGPLALSYLARAAMACALWLAGSLAKPVSVSLCYLVRSVWAWVRISR